MKIPKFMTNTWVVSTLLVLILFLIVPYFFIHPEAKIVSQKLNQTKLDIPNGVYIYKMTLKKEFIEQVKNGYNAMNNQSYNPNNLNNSNDSNQTLFDIKKIPKETMIKFQVVKKDSDYMVASNISKGSPVFLDKYGNEIGSNDSLMLTKSEYNIMFSPWMSSIDNDKWIWKTGKQLDIMDTKIKVNEINLKVIGETGFKNRSAYLIRMDDGINMVNYTLDKEYKIALGIDTINYHSELVSSPFLK